MKQDIAIDLSMFIVSIKVIKESLSAPEFEDFLEILSEANDKVLLEPFLNSVELIYSEGTDLASSIRDSYYDLLVDLEEKINHFVKK